MISRIHYDDATLARLLQDELADDEQGVARHIEQCTDCLERLESLSRDGMTWEEVGTLLRSEPEDEQEQNSPERTFLQPTDHPGSLGRFGRYEIIEFLGRGGMGIVMKGYDPALDRYSAVKVLAPELASSAAARKRFSREARSAAAVVHPHVVPIQTVDEHDGLPYLVMPVVEGRSLQQRVEEHGPLEIVEVVRIAAQVAEGLAAAHAQGLVHRDIKPANILLENGVERVQITDFGLARAADDASMTRSGIIAGTPQYMSPEQAHGDEIDHRSDLFSLGSVMYFMLTGRSPFRAETTMGVLNRIAHDEPRRLRSIRPEIPAWLEKTVMRLLEKKPSNRPESAASVARDLHAKLAELQHSPEPSENRRVSLGLRWLAVAAIIAVLACSAGVVLLKSDQGTIRIETNSASAIPLVIRQGDEVVKRLTVDSDGVTTRVRAGSYVIELEHENAAVTVKNSRAVVKANGTWVSRIEFTPTSDAAGTSSRSELSKESPKSDPNKVREQALEDVRHGRYEAALEKILWYWENAVVLDSSLSAVRRSFLLADWLTLSEAYPPALEKLRATRDELERAVLSTDQIRVHIDDFADLAAINRTLREDDRTMQVYQTILNRDPEDANRLRHYLPKNRTIEASTAESSLQEIRFALEKDGQIRHLTRSAGRVVRMDELETYLAGIEKGGKVVQITIDADPDAPYSEVAKFLEVLRGSELLKGRPIRLRRARADEDKISQSAIEVGTADELLTGRFEVIAPRRFETPEDLMEFAAACQTRGDTAGFLACWTDEAVKQVATSYLLLATAMQQDFANNPKATRPPDYEAKMQELQSILEDEIGNRSTALALSALATALRESAATEKEKESETAPLPDPLAGSTAPLVAATATELIKNPRRFVRRFDRWSNSQGESREEEPKTCRYKIEVTGEKAIATSQMNGYTMELKNTDKGWLISNPFRGVGAGE